MKSLILVVAMFVAGCANTVAQQPQPTVPRLNGHYTYWATGQYWGGGQNGGNALPAGVPGTDSKTLFDSGTFEADVNGGITQCGGGSWGTWSTPLNCVTWAVVFNTSDNGTPLNPRLGIIKSNVGDIATIACTETGKHCVMTAHDVGWAWTQILDKE